MTPTNKFQLKVMALYALLCGVVIGFFLLVVGCGPKTPPADLILWEQPSPQLAAQAHAKERPGLIAYLVAPTGSMEPYLTGGDYIVVDKSIPFDKKSLPPGSLCTYLPDWHAETSVTHMLAAWSGNEAIMDGIANKHYERGSLRMTEKHYTGKVIKVYTKRRKP